MSKQLFFQFLMLLILLSTSCKSKHQDSVITIVDVTQAKVLIKETNDLVILDVRTPEETSQGIIEGTIIADFNKDDFKDKINKLDKLKPILVYCKAGSRSETASEIMKEMGFTKIYYLTDGYNGWKESNE